MGSIFFPYRSLILQYYSKPWKMWNCRCLTSPVHCQFHIIHFFILRIYTYIDVIIYPSLTLNINLEFFVHFLNIVLRMLHGTKKSFLCVKKSITLCLNEWHWHWMLRWKSEFAKSALGAEVRHRSTDQVCKPEHLTSVKYTCDCRRRKETGILGICRQSGLVQWETLPQKLK